MGKRFLFGFLILLIIATVVTAVAIASGNEKAVIAIDNSDLDPVKLENGTQERTAYEISALTAEFMPADEESV